MSDYEIRKVLKNQFKKVLVSTLILHTLFMLSIWTCITLEFYIGLYPILLMIIGACIALNGILWED